jgi:type II secretory pathway component PulC
MAMVPKTDSTSRVDVPNAPRQKKWLPRAFSISLALGFGAWVAVEMWPHLLDFRNRQPPKPDAPSLTTAPAVPPPLVAPDVNTSLLGTDSSIAQDAQTLVLVATNIGRISSDSTAMLGTDPRNPQTYALGAILANGAVISQIHADRVVLSLNGRRTTLMADREAGSRIAMRDTLAKSKNASSTVLDSLSIEAGSDPAALVGGPSSVNRPLDRTSTSRDDLSEVIRSQPVFEREKFAGLQVFAGTRKGMLAQLGLQDGDIVRSVEGQLVDGEEDWQAIDDAITTGSSIVIGIERGGSLMSVSVDGAQLASAPPESASPTG